MSAQGLSKQSKKKMITFAVIAVAVIVAIIILNVLTEGKLLNPKNLKNVLAGSVVPTLVAFGFLIVFTGNVTDLSPGGIVILACTATGLLGNAYGVPVMVIGGIAVGVGCMLLNFLVYRITKIPPWIAGLGLLMVYEAIAVNYANSVAAKGQKVVVMNNDIRFLGQQPGIYICWIIGIVVAYIIFNHTSLGINYRATGDNEDVAKIMGINVDKYKVLAFILSGAFLGVMAVLTISYGSSMVAVTGMASMSRNFVPTMGCFFGLAFKKYGMPLQAIVIGEFVINIIFFGFIAMGAPTAIQDVITGLALLIIITVTTKVTKGEIVK